MAKRALPSPLAVLLLLALLATAIYSNTFSASFHFDDTPNIVENHRIKDLSNFTDLSGSRYVGFLSFALNYHFGGLSLLGYHLVNLIIHIINGFLVYQLVLLIGGSFGIGLSTALLFVVHPIQTQAVTYIVQRFASLATLFYLLAVVCHLEWRSTPAGNKRGYLWYCGALLSTVLAMKTKENSFTLPLMILLVEAIFFRPLTRKRWISLIPFFVTLLIIPFSRSDVMGEAEAGLFRQTTEISRMEYLFTQFRVIVTYLRLLVLPINQNLDYDYPVYHSLFDPSVLLSFLFLLSLLALSFYLFSRSKLIAFGIFWFFLTLSVESSIIPIRDVIFEHRLYLPSVGLSLTAAVAWALGAQRLRSSLGKMVIGPVSMGTILLLFSVATSQRNLIWRDDVTLWKDVVAKAPNNTRGYNNLGVGYEGIGRLEEAIREYQTALRLRPDYALAHDNLGSVYKSLGRFKEAIREHQTALQFQPDYARAHNNLGSAYRDQGRLEEAIREYQIALKLQPDFAKAHNNLGVAYRDQGRLEEAIREYQTALRLQPNLAEAHNNLGIAYRNQGRLAEAIREYQTALGLKPGFAEVHNNLGIAYSNQGRLEQAIREYQTALKLQPDFAEAHNNLGIAYSNQGRLEQAIKEYQAALQIQQNYAEAHNNLGIAYRNQGRLAEAIREYQTALRLKPDYAEAHNNLGLAYSDQGHPEQAIREYQTALQLQPDYTNAHYNLGLVYRSRAMLPAARSEFEQALRIMPDFLPARQALEALPR